MNSNSRKITLPESWQGEKCQICTLVQIRDLRNEYGSYYGLEVRLDPRPGKDNAVVESFVPDEIFDVWEQRRIF